MSFPGYPSDFDSGWWRQQLITPPVFAGTGTTATNGAAVTSFAASWRMQALTPLAGQQVAGTGVPAGTTILASPAPTATGFTMSQAATANGTGVGLTIGTEPVTLAEAKAWSRVEFDDDDSLIQDIITATREEIEGPGLRQAMMLQSRCMYFMGFPWSGGYYNRMIRSMGPNPWWLPTAQGIIQLCYPPLQAVTSIQYIDPASGDLLLIGPDLPTGQPAYLYSALSVPGRVQPQYGAVWPLARPVIDSVQITFTCGYGPLESDVPAAARLAMRSVIAATYENREAFLEGGGLTITPHFERFLAASWWGSYI